MTIALTILFWFAIGWVVYVFIGYPVLMFLLSRLRPHPLRRTPGYQPSVCFVMAAYNEEKGISDKLRNYQELDYPRHLLSFSIGSDASTDATESIIESFRAADPSISLARFDRCGKTRIVYELADSVDADIIVFTDADVVLEQDGLRRIIDCFSDSRVGGVIGRMVYHDLATNAGSTGQNKYLELENGLRHTESLFWTTVGPRGECFAVRRGSYTPLHSYKLSDDLNLVITIPLNGYRVWYEPDVLIHELTKRSLGTEFKRRLRMGQQAAATLLAYRGTRLPWRSLVGFQIWSHKLLRNLAAVPMALAALAALALAPTSTFFLAISALIVTWGFAMLVGWLCSTFAVNIRVLHYPLYFTAMLASLAIGSVRAVFSGGLEMWNSQRVE